MGWWTRLIADGAQDREEQFLRQEVARLEQLSPSPRVLTALGRLWEWLDEPAAAIETYRRALELLRETEDAPWRELQLRERIAICEGAPPSPPTLELEQEGRTALLGTSVCLLGRGSRTTDLLVPAGTVAREHCVIWFDGARWRVRDLGSTNGTTLDGAALVGTGTIEGAAVLRLADRVLKVKILANPREPSKR